MEAARKRSSSANYWRGSRVGAVDAGSLEAQIAASRAPQTFNISAAGADATGSAANMHWSRILFLAVGVSTGIRVHDFAHHAVRVGRCSGLLERRGNAKRTAATGGQANSVTLGVMSA